MKKTIKKVIEWLLDKLSNTATGRFVHRSLIDKAMSKTANVNHNETSLVFSIPNTLNEYRVNSFSSKEPETLEWIDSFKEGSVFWDIGANVGLYTCYAAKKKDCLVISFEPSVFNLELLARNIFLNSATNAVTIVPLPLSDNNEANTLNMSTTEWGGALSTFGKSYGQDGKDLIEIFKFKTYGFKMDYLAEVMKLPLPKYIKIDVDGIEHLILKGGSKTLSTVDGVLIEIDDNFSEQEKKCSELLTSSGLELIEKRHGRGLEGTGQYNQIWKRGGN